MCIRDRIQTGQFFDLFQTIHQRVAVDKQAAAGLRHIQVVLKEELDGDQGLLIQALDAALLEHRAQEHLADSGGQLVDQAGNAKVVVADDLLLGVEHLSLIHI